MKFVKIKNHLINLEKCFSINCKYAPMGTAILFNNDIEIHFDSEGECKAAYEKLLQEINGLGGGTRANGSIPNLTEQEYES